MAEDCTYIVYNSLKTDKDAVFRVSLTYDLSSLSVIMQQPAFSDDSLIGQVWYFDNIDRDVSIKKLSRFRGTVNCHFS